MRIRDTRLAALAAATGLWMCFTAPAAQAACTDSGCPTTSVKRAAATDGKPVVLSKFSKRKSTTLRKSRSETARLAAKKSGSALHGKTSKADTSGTKASEKLPSWFANANAALPNATRGTPTDDQARNIAAADDNEVITMDGVQIASAEQLNDIDRAVADDKPEIKADDGATAAPATATPQGRILRPIPSGERQVLANTDSDPWSKTSLIGKIFIAFGSLLTVASAARMLIA